MLRGFAAWSEIADPISRRGMSNKLWSAICVGTTRSAYKMDWPTYLPDIPTERFSKGKRTLAWQPSLGRLLVRQDRLVSVYQSLFRLVGARISQMLVKPLRS